MFAHASIFDCVWVLAARVSSGFEKNPAFMALKGHRPRFAVESVWF
jgi:hypothetical protein